MKCDEIKNIAQKFYISLDKNVSGKNKKKKKDELIEEILQVHFDNK